MSRDPVEVSDARSHHTYRVEEWGYAPIPATELLSDGELVVYPSVLDNEYFTLRHKAGRIQLQAGSFVGVIPLNDRVTIEVTPRVPVRNLAQLLTIANYAPVALQHAARRYTVDHPKAPSLVDLYALALATSTEEISLRGKYREYIRRQEATSFPRGRLLLTATAKSLVPRGQAHKIAVSWYERTVNNPPNQCIKYAIWFLARHRADPDSGSHLPPRAIQALNRAFRSFDGVDLDPALRFMTDPVVLGRRPLPSLRAYYRPVLDLSLAVIRQQGINWDRETGELKLPSLVIKMASVFEAYLRNLLKTRASEDSWDLTVLDGNTKAPHGGGKPLLDGGLEVQATPDIVFAGTSDKGRVHPLLLEAKYKPSDRSIDRDDLNQAITYGVSYKCPHVVLVRPRAFVPKRALGLRKLGTTGALTLHEYVFDLGAEDLAQEERQFTREMAALAGLRQPQPSLR